VRRRGAGCDRYGFAAGKLETPSRQSSSIQRDRTFSSGLWQIMADPQTVSKPQVFLNHFYVVLDSTTSNAVEHDAFLRRQFARNEKRTTTNAEMTYTGLYFYGVNTYFEFFDIASSPGHRVGDSAIAFGVDQPRAIETLEERLGQSLEPGVKSVTRLYQGKQIPWFFMATAKNLPYESELSCWLMEYHPEFLGHWNPQPQGANRGISRKQILQRYSEVLEPVNEPVLEDVVGLTVAADDPHKTNLIDFCLQLGYQAERKEREVALRGPDFVLLLVPATENVRGIREIRMRTRNPREQEREHLLGQSVLKFASGSAIWSLR
jgi:hypothetical protein